MPFYFRAGCRSSDEAIRAFHSASHLFDQVDEVSSMASKRSGQDVLVRFDDPSPSRQSASPCFTLLACSNRLIPQTPWISKRHARTRSEQTIAMVTFQVQVNGEAPTKAGAEGATVLAATVTYVAARNALELRVGGMTCGVQGAAHVDWVTRDPVVGDVVTIKGIESAEASEPIRSEPVNPKLEEQQMREYYETLKKGFEP